MFSNQNNLLLTAIVTPFNQDETIDYISYSKLLKFQVNQEVDGIVILGSTGESACLDTEEKNKLIEVAVTEVNKSIPIIVGTGSNCTRSTIQNSHIAFSNGADAVMIVTPYYNNPSNPEIYEHFKKINANLNGPFILYHVPTRTGAKLDLHTVQKILKLSNCIGFKDATANLLWLDSIKDDYGYIFSGDDLSAYDYCQHGGHGLISVISNVYPELTKNFMINHDKGIIPLLESMNLRVNPVPIKWLLSHHKLIKSNQTRSPLMPLEAQFQKALMPYIIEELQ